MSVNNNPADGIANPFGAAAQPTGGFVFGATGAGDTAGAFKPQTTTSFFGQNTTPSSTLTLGGSPSAPKSTVLFATPTTTPFRIGTTTNAPTSLTTGLATTAASGGILPTATTTTGIGAPAATSLGGAFTFSGASTTTTGGVGGGGGGLSITSTAQPQLGQPPASSAPAVNLTTGTTTTQSSSQPTGQLNFCQVEEYINKWILELEEQEKIFTNQATQINAWDKVLISNSEKIVTLNESVEKVKTEQKALEQELEFILAQHSELDECIKPLEKELSKIVQVDVERAQTYMLAEKLDTQLKQMSEDLKEVIEHLNEANKDRDPNDPIVQIGKILNAHMGSLQWIETSTSVITSKLDEISKIHESLKRDNERSFRLNFLE